MFENALRKKFRFDTPRGALNVEDLWDLPLTHEKRSSGFPNLDDIARSLHKQLKSGDDVSFVTPERASDPTIQAKFDLVIHIINVKKAEKAALEKAQEKAAKKQKLLGLMAEKEDETLKGMSMDELRAALADL